MSSVNVKNRRFSAITKTRRRPRRRQSPRTDGDAALVRRQENRPATSADFVLLPMLGAHDERKHLRQAVRVGRPRRKVCKSGTKRRRTLSNVDLQIQERGELRAVEIV
jgi:hypothetical protein